MRLLEVLSSFTAHLLFHIVSSCLLSRGFFTFFKKCLVSSFIFPKSQKQTKPKKKTLPCLFWTQFASLIFVSHGPMILLLTNNPFQLSNLSQPHFITLKLTYNRIFVCTQIGPFSTLYTAKSIPPIFFLKYYHENSMKNG